MSQRFQVHNPGWRTNSFLYRESFPHEDENKQTKQNKTNTSTHAIKLKNTINSTLPNLIRSLRRNFQWPYPRLMPGLPPSSCSKKFPSFHPFLVVVDSPPPFLGKHIGSGGEKALGLGQWCPSPAKKSFNKNTFLVIQSDLFGMVKWPF